MDGKRILDRYNSHLLYSTTITSARYVRYVSLRYFFIIAHAQNFPVLFFSAVKCLHVLLNGLEKVYPTSLNPIEIC